MATAFLALAHAPLLLYAGWPVTGERVWPDESVYFIAHQVLGVLGSVGVLGALLCAGRLLSLRDLGLILAFVHAAWTGVALQHAPLLTRLIRPSLPLGFGLGLNYMHALRVLCFAAALFAAVSSRRWRETGRRSTVAWVLLLLLTAAHGAAAVLDTQHLVPAAFVVTGDPAVVTQMLVGVVHFPGFLAGLLALLTLVNARSAALVALSVQLVWGGLKLLFREQYSAFFDSKQLTFEAVMAIHGAQIAAALLLFVLAPRAAVPAAAAKSKRQ